jgi:hypothetical protein
MIAEALMPRHESAVLADPLLCRKIQGNQRRAPMLKKADDKSKRLALREDSQKSPMLGPSQPLFTA